ncbi:MDR family MFS transporter [Hydrogenibacillus schlegelii]|uniref:Drug resistance transporter, EmrB/QacA family n=1 Tax=Hydrogenibacillus schlegelii TaxID=1484 RepID=A0A179IN94_HYDSH|nr:MDR family MFS transporter [Hydrogenibacillus schlegelii]OAR03249.1 hypothetical protein SA87_05055 [Hydrogenibacillus schlegelii]PTQ53761.1 MAG: drug resistance transporter, EmrB/QacA family [Hydrogenibacillus schlegelii]
MAEPATLDERIRASRPYVLAAAMLGMFMAAVESTIVATAMPTIVGDLGGFRWIGWVFSGFMLAQAVTTPIFGKVADLFGRRPAYAGGVALFLLGSILSGLAPSMGWLIAFRFLQGLGAGSVMPIAQTMIGDVYPGTERARVQGWLSSVWALSALTGPMIGALIVKFWHWSWIFWINVPVGAVSVALVLLFLEEPARTERPAIDWAGAAALFLALVGWMGGLLFSGSLWPWQSWETAALLALGLGASAFFVWAERRAREPVMPPALFRERLIAVANGATFITGAALIALSTFLPSYVQGVLGRPPEVAGMALTAMSIGWPLGSFVLGRLYGRIGPRAAAIAGAVFLFVGGTMFALMRPAYGALYAGAASFWIGLGMGFTNTAYIVAIQSRVPWALRGAATSTNLFMRLFGGTVGAAVFGALLNRGVERALVAGGLSPDEAERAMRALGTLFLGGGLSGVTGVDPALLASALEAGMRSVFVGLWALTFVNGALVWLLPGERLPGERRV